MNKKLITAVAVATLGASPAVFAAADLYGMLDIGVQIVDPGSSYVGSKTFVNDTQGSGGSLLGWRTSEDLGGGLKALATLELGMFTDTGNLDNQTTALPTATQLFQRQIFAGLTGGFGTITAGRHYTEIFLVGATSAYNYTAAQIGTFFLDAGIGVRQSNSIKYVSPSLGGGLNIAALYAPGEGTTATTKDNGYTEFSVRWAAGPLKVGLASATSTATGNVDTDITALGGQYTFGPSTVYALLTTRETGTTVDVTATSLGYKHNLGSGDIIVQVGTRKDKVTSSADSTLTSLAYYHQLSKTTTAYAAYGSMDNDTGAALSLARQAAATGVAGDDPTAWSFGIRKTF